MLTACDNNTYLNISESDTPILTTESSEIETTSESIQTQTENESIIEEIIAIQRPLSEISTEENDLFAKNYNNGEPIFDDKGGYYYKKIVDHYCFYPILYYDKGDGNPIKTKLPESRCFFYDLVFHNDALYGILHQDLKEGSFFIMKYQNESLEMIINDPIEHWYFAEEGIYYQIDNAIYLTDYDGINSELIVKIPDDLYIDSDECGFPRDCKFVVYHDSIWYQHYSRYDKTEIPLWNYNIDSKSFTKIYMKINEAYLEAVNNGFLYFSSTNRLWRLNTDTYCIEQVSDQEFRSVNFFDDNILFITSKNEVFKINSSGMVKFLDKSNKEFGYDEPYYDNISIYENRIFLTVQYGEDHGKIVEIDLEGNMIKQICDY